MTEEQYLKWAADIWSRLPPQGMAFTDFTTDQKSAFRDFALLLNGIDPTDDQTL